MLDLVQLINRVRGNGIIVEDDYWIDSDDERESDISVEVRKRLSISLDYRDKYRNTYTYRALDCSTVILDIDTLRTQISVSRQLQRVERKRVDTEKKQFLLQQKLETANAEQARREQQQEQDKAWKEFVDSRNSTAKLQLQKVQEEEKQRTANDKENRRLTKQRKRAANRAAHAEQQREREATRLRKPPENTRQYIEAYNTWNRGKNATALAFKQQEPVSKLTRAKSIEIERDTADADLSARLRAFRIQRRAEIEAEADRKEQQKLEKNIEDLQAVVEKLTIRLQKIQEIHNILSTQNIPTSNPVRLTGNVRRRISEMDLPLDMLLQLDENDCLRVLNLSLVENCK